MKIKVGLLLQLMGMFLFGAASIAFPDFVGKAIAIGAGLLTAMWTVE